MINFVYGLKINDKKVYYFMISGNITIIHLTYSIVTSRDSKFYAIYIWTYHGTTVAEQISKLNLLILYNNPSITPLYMYVSIVQLSPSIPSLL